MEERGGTNLGRFALIGGVTLGRFNLHPSEDERVGACCHVFGQAHQVLTVGFLLLLYSVTYTLLSPYLNFVFFYRHCLRVRYRTSRLRGYGSGTGPLDTDSRGPVPDLEPRL